MCHRPPPYSRARKYVVAVRLPSVYVCSSNVTVLRTTESRMHRKPVDLMMFS